MKKKTARALHIPKTGPSRGMRPIDVASRLRRQRDEISLLLSDLEARLEIVEIEAADEQRNA